MRSIRIALWSLAFLSMASAGARAEGPWTLEKGAAALYISASRYVFSSFAGVDHARYALPQAARTQYLMSARFGLTDNLEIGGVLPYTSATTGEGRDELGRDRSPISTLSSWSVGIKYRLVDEYRTGSISAAVRAELKNGGSYTAVAEYAPGDAVSEALMAFSLGRVFSMRSDQTFVYADLDLGLRLREGYPNEMVIYGDFGVSPIALFTINAFLEYTDRVSGINYNSTEYQTRLRHDVASRSQCSSALASLDRDQLFIGGYALINLTETLTLDLSYGRVMFARNTESDGKYGGLGMGVSF